MKRALNQSLPLVHPLDTDAGVSGLFAADHRQPRRPVAASPTVKLLKAAQEI